MIFQFQPLCSETCIWLHAFACRKSHKFKCDHIIWDWDPTHKFVANRTEKIAINFDIVVVQTFMLVQAVEVLWQKI